MSGNLITAASMAERYAVLLDLANVLSSAQAPERLYPAIHAHVARVVPTTSFHILVVGGSPTPAEVFAFGPPSGDALLSTAEMEQLAQGDFVVRGSSPLEPRAVIAAPLVRKAKMVGCLAATRPSDQPFEPADAHFLLAVGRLAGVALYNLWLYGEARERSRDAARFEAVARELGASLDLGAVVERIAERAHEQVEKPIVIWVVDDQRLRAVASAGGAAVRIGAETALSPALSKLLDDDVRRARITLAKRANVAMAAAAPLMLPPGSASGGEFGALVPLSLGERIVGIIAVGPCGESPPDPGSVQLIERMAPHAASAIENARLHAEVRRLSLTDPLVRLPNRRQLDAYLAREFAAAQRGRPLCLVLFDLDRFKHYNDTYGHHEGDLALIRFAEVLRRETRAMNLSARYGGEEFAAVLSDTSTDGARSYAERVRERMFAEFDGRLTVSAGAAAYTESMSMPAELIIAADRALYRAKIEGRNRVHVES